MSNSFDRKVAETRALQEYITQRALEASTPKSPNASELSTPTLLKLRIDNFAAAGVDVSKFSVLPDEGEGESEEEPESASRLSTTLSLSPHYPFPDLSFVPLSCLMRAHSRLPSMYLPRA